ncbi:hypothetical protein GCM10011511_16310 [Puia dinghuensis]|uniref:Signal transduction histidine kinase internal region domain-containing protein n=2 Tax=Puia dinghuensis TaxID=1792502 RepID=A0A8J2XQJ5_9BACT|nr:hypothetical protein GCM10011511_16310 [Puia dinghuensis]
MKALLSLIVCLAFFPIVSLAQEYSYAHYGIAEGLAGSTVYCITQDKDGFIWTGTETGVSRFDGSHFKNFTTKDGLPDLEVVQLFADSRGRVWMAPLRKSICYYYQGRIHTEQNDSVLGHIRLDGNLWGFAEDAAGNILLQEKNVLHILGADGSLTDVDSLDGAPVSNCFAVSASTSGGFLAEINGKIVEFSGNKCLHSMRIPYVGSRSNDFALSSGTVVWNERGLAYNILSFGKKRIIRQAWDKQHHRSIAFTAIGDSLVYSNELDGSHEYNIRTGQTRTYLPGIAVSRVFKDASGDLWFTTMGAGLYRLISNDVRSISFTVERTEKATVTALARVGHELWVGDNHNYIFRLSLPGLTLREQHLYFPFKPERILIIDTTKDGKILAGGDGGVQEDTRDLRPVGDIFGGGLKSLTWMNERTVLATYSWGAGTFDLPLTRNARMKDTLLKGRATIAFYTHDTIYLGTMDGLYRLVKGRPRVFLGDGVPFLRNRISAIVKAEDGTLWIGSYDDAGIIGYKNGREVAALTRQQGLTSDICRCLQVHNNILWVGTDKGLNRVELDKPGYPITRYTSRDGLASDMINTVLADSSRIYVGTSEGLSYFDEQKPVNSEGCRLHLLSVMNSGRERIVDTADLVIPYRDKHLRLEFAGISYRSAGDITYRYRMLGLDSTWRETKENTLDYPELPSGEYEWQLIAVNKFGNWSRMLQLPVTVDIQWWKKPWFVVGAWLLSLVLSWLLVSSRIRIIRRRQREKEGLLQRMSDLESTALKSQMNPHFIFNCLTSIQLLNLSGDTGGSNQYITGLAKLIRMTLHNSSRTFVSIGDEVDYLSSYLSLEKMRFKEKIDYEIVVDTSIHPGVVLIPPMLIQPFVENALKHGLAHKVDGKGFISIRMRIADDRIVIVIEDNGVGRKEAAARPKSAEWKEYPSRGLSLTEDRIGIMNKLYAGDAGIEVTDLQDSDGSPAGTRVTLRLPIFYGRPQLS